MRQSCITLHLTSCPVYNLASFTTLIVPAAKTEEKQFKKKFQHRGQIIHQQKELKEKKNVSYSTWRLMLTADKQNFEYNKTLLMNC